MKIADIQTVDVSGVLALTRDVCDAQLAALDLEGQPGLWIDSDDAATNGLRDDKSALARKSTYQISIPLPKRLGGSHGCLVVFLEAELSPRIRRQLDLIAGQLAAQLDLEASMSRYRRTMDHIPAMIAYWDREQRCRFANRIYFDWFGIGPERLLGVQMRELLGDELYAKNEVHILGALKGDIQIFERDLVRKKYGDLRHTQATYLPDVVDGDVRGFFVLVADVTERKQAELAAIEASKTKSRFLANMSHELRTPLNGVLGMLELARTSHVHAEVLDYLKIASSSAEHLFSVIEDILDLSRIEAGQLVLTPSTFSLRTLFDNTMSSLKSQAERNGLRLTVDIADAVEDGRRGDEIRLRQLLFNLVGNAIKFTKQGSIRVSVRATPDSRDSILFEVEDTGLGIPADKLQTIFEPFRQVDESRTRDRGGSGLGLAICKEIVAKMSGEIKVVSTLGQGSKFSFNVLLPVETSIQAAAPEQVDFDHASSEDLIPLSVLMVEDDDISARIQGIMIKKLKCNLVHVSDGAEALRALENGVFDFVLMDVQMPVLDGLQTTARIRAQEVTTGKHVPIVALTANAFESDREQCLAAGMDLYLTKPLRLAQLAKIVEQYRTLAQP